MNQMRALSKGNAQPYSINQVERREKITFLRHMDTLRFRQARISCQVMIMLMRLLFLSYALTISLMPVAAVPVFVLGFRLPAILFGVGPFAAICTLCLPRLSGANLTATSGLLFWGGLSVYLSLLGLSSIVHPSDTTATFFFSRILLLFVAFLMGVCTCEVIREGQFEKIITRSAVAGLLIFLAFFLLSAIQAGFSLSSFVEAALGLNFSQYIRMNEKILSFWAGEEGPSISGSERMPVLKNSLAEGIAILMTFLLITIQLQPGKGKLIKTVTLTGLVAILFLSLSRSAVLYSMVAVLWLLFPLVQKHIAWFLVAMLLLGLGLVSIALAFPSYLEIAGAQFQENRQRSNEIRSEQYLGALRHRHQSRLGLLIGDGLYTGYGGLRIHNMLLSAWVEGGLAATAAIALHYLAILHRIWASMLTENADRRGNLLIYCGCAIPILVGLRTLTNGGGGFYSVVGLLAMGCFWGICAAGVGVTGAAVWFVNGVSAGDPGRESQPSRSTAD